MEEIRNTGLNLDLEQEHISDDDYVFLGSRFGEEKVETDYTQDLPTGELQKRNDQDKMCCTTMGLHNTIETKINNMIRRKVISVNAIKWLGDNGYLDKNGKLDLSDRFNATLAGTTTNGNSLIKPVKTFHEYGAIPEKMLPYRESMSWNEFYNNEAITKEMFDLGKKFLEIFPMNYEKVYRNKFDDALDYDPLDGAGHAWTSPINGVYQRTHNRINHCFEIFRKAYKAFDSYEESKDDYVKQLASNYIFLNYAYRIIIRENATAFPEEDNNMPTFLREKGDTKVYQMCADGTVVHIYDDKLFEKLYGKESYDKIKEVPFIDPKKKAGTLHSLKGFYRLFAGLFS